LKSARARRETYVGPWLPEPIFDDPQGQAESRADDITLSLMLALERLSPLERAAFLLHDVFDLALDEVAEALERDPAACRKLATRAREHVKQARPRYGVPRERGTQIAQAFYVASRSGDVSVLRQLLAEDVIVYSDGGGKRSAATKPILGRDRAARFYQGLARKERFELASFYAAQHIDGLPVFDTTGSHGLPQTTALEIDDDRIVAVYTVRNPDKLGHLRFPTRINAPELGDDKIAAAEALTRSAAEAAPSLAGPDVARVANGLFRH
jgi:RNA polymerase sigma-70 factor (ECF subfamily)